MAAGEEPADFASILRSSLHGSSNISRPNSMVVKKVTPREIIPPEIVAEAISSLRGLDMELRWSGPITPAEMQYVEQYVHAKYPQYANGLIGVEGADDVEVQRTQPSPSPGMGSNLPELDRTQLIGPTRLLDIVAKKSSVAFVSIPEIQARNRALRHCGLSEGEYLAVFSQSHQDAMAMVGESYPFFRGSYYLTAVGEEADGTVRRFAAAREARVIPAPESWLDLRIKGSQLSQQFRRKCKRAQKGLFSYPADVGGIRYSMHWVSEAHRNSWHVLLDATAIPAAGDGGERLSLALHRPDFVLCTLENNNNANHQRYPSKVTCLLVRTKSFDTSPSSSP